MARSVRDQMVDSAVILLAKHGLDGTSFTEVLTASGAPAGPSITTFLAARTN